MLKENGQHMTHKLDTIHEAVIAEVELHKNKLSDAKLTAFYIHGIEQSCSQIFEFTVILSSTYLEVFEQYKIYIESVQKAANSTEALIKEFTGDELDNKSSNRLLEGAYVLIRSMASVIFKILCDFTDYDVRKALASANQGTNLLFINSN